MTMRVQYIAGYKVTHCPRYSEEKYEKQFEENLLIQKTFWNALHFITVGKCKVSIELRFVSQLPERSISILILLVKQQPDITIDIQNLALDRLLPQEYGWSKISQSELEQVIKPNKPSHTYWKVSRLIRRMEFLDLPTFPAFTSKKIGLQVMPGENAYDNSVPPYFTVPGFLLMDHDSNQKRQILNDKVVSLEQIQSALFCLPLLGKLTDKRLNHRRLCQQMQHGAPAVLSLTLHPINPQALDSDRVLAKRWGYFLELLNQALDNGEHSRFQELLSCYERYWSPSNHFCHLTLRVAATQDEYALGIAHSLAAQLGGVKVFDVTLPSKNFDSLDILTDPTIDMPPKALLGLEKFLNLLNVEEINDENIANFISRMPHLYVLDEVESILRLPSATEEGLPGIETRMLPPFYTASTYFQPVLERNGEMCIPPDEQIRVGLIENSQIINEAEDNSSLSVNLNTANWHTLPINDLCKHALITGSTGSGKTITTLFLTRELTRLNIPFLVIEPVKTEYYRRLKLHTQLDRWHLEGGINNLAAPGFLWFDPMRLQSGVTVATHVSYLKSCFEAAFPLDQVMALFLENGLLAYYTDSRENGGCGFRLFTRGGQYCHEIGEYCYPANQKGQQGAVYPSFETFSLYFIHHFLEKELALPGADAQRSSEARERLEISRQIFRRRFENLTKGPLGEAFRQADDMIRSDLANYNPFRYWLQRNTVIELDAVPDNEQKSLLMAFLLTFVFEYRQAEDWMAREQGKPPSSALKHVLIVEEAHRLLSNSPNKVGGDYVGGDSQAKAVSLFVDMLAEIRAFGQGIVIVEQIPTKIVPEAVKNTNLKIMLRLTSKNDRDYLGEAMNFNEEQKRFVTNLRAEPGKSVQFVAFEETLDQPILLSLPLRKQEISNKHPWLFNEFF